MSYRRIADRFLLEGCVHLVTQEGKKARLSIKNISPSGLVVFDNHTLGVNEIVSVVVDVTPFFDRPVFKKARVAWCNQAGAVSWEAGLDWLRF